jgi:cyanophycinase
VPPLASKRWHTGVSSEVVVRRACDNSTGPLIVFRLDQFSVFGNSYVAIYDGTRWSAERDTIYSLPPGSRDFYLLSKGQKYNLRNRKVITD